MIEEGMRARQHDDVVLHAAEDMADTLRAGLENLQETACILQNAAERSAGVISELAQCSADHTMQGFGSGDGEYRRLSLEASENLQALAETSMAFAHVFEDVSREWLRLNQRCLQQNLDGFNALTRCRSMTEFLVVRSSLVLNNLEQSAEAGRRFAAIAIRLADEATKALAVQGESTTQDKRAVRRASCPT